MIDLSCLFDCLFVCFIFNVGLGCFFFGVFISITCDDAPEEAPSIEISSFRQLKVNIGSGGKKLLGLKV